MSSGLRLACIRIRRLYFHFFFPKAISAIIKMIYTEQFAYFTQKALTLDINNVFMLMFGIRMDVKISGEVEIAYL